MMPPVRLIAILLLAASAAGAQEHVASTADDFVLPEVIPGRQPDADLVPALRRFNGQHALDGLRQAGVVDRVLPASLGWRGTGEPVVAEGVVLRSDAYLTPDRTGAVTVLTVEPSAILEMPAGYPPGSAQSPRRRGGTGGPEPPAALPSVLRFALAGGVVYTDDNNGVAVQQTGVNYPAAGNALILFGETLPRDPSSGRSSATLLLVAACSLQDGACASIDGNQANTDALTARIPGGLAMAEAFNMDGAAIADPGMEGVRGLAESIEARYDLRAGDLRRQAGPELPMFAPFSPARAAETLVRAHVLSTDASLTVGGTGLVSHALVSVDQVLTAAEGVGRPRTMEIYQRGGFLRVNDDVVMPALLTAQLPLVAGGDYFLAVGLTDDNRWELRASWRIVGDEVFAMDRPRTQQRTRSAESYWPSTAQFIH